MLKYSPDFADTTSQRYHVERMKLDKAVADKRRGTPEERGYDKDWYRVRWSIISQQPPCSECGASYEKGFHVDHVERFEGISDPKRLDPNNLQVLCPTCHSRKTAKRDGGFGNKRWP